MLATVRCRVRQLAVTEEGLETVEYAIITGLILAGTIGVIAAIGVWVLAQFQTVQGALGA